MDIFHPINSFLYRLFNVSQDDREALITSVRDYYSVAGMVPEVTESNGFLRVSLRMPAVQPESSRFTKLISLCENRKFSEAYPLAQQIAADYPTNSEINRIKGQIESELGETDKAIDSLIDALRWDPKNTYALIMMGNIFARERDDIPTAMTYYNQAAEINPEDNIALNNIAANLMAMGRKEEARALFLKAEEKNPGYPNTKYALALYELDAGNTLSAFEYALKAVALLKLSDPLFTQVMSILEKIARVAGTSSELTILIQEYSTKLEKLTGKEIRIEEDSTIPTAAKVELAENYNRTYHLVKFKQGYPGVAHLIMHELKHVQLAEEARLAGTNRLFTSSAQERRKFMVDYRKYAESLQRRGYQETAIAGVLNSLFEGLNRQVFNTAIDLFIEDQLYNEYPALRPVQFFSLHTLLQEGKDAVTRKDIIELSDAKILSKSKIYNLVGAHHFRQLYGIDYLKQYRPTLKEQELAQTMYDEYLEYRDDRQPGEEYELIQHWGDDLHLYRYFSLLDESTYRNSGKPDVLTPEWEDIDDNTAADRDIEMHEFAEAHKAEDLNPAVMMYMVGALKHFADKPKDEIKVAAFQIATQGMNGIDPAKKEGYRVPAIPDSNFSGYQMLAYYYVSWALTAPQMLPELKLPFDKEFESAKAFLNP